MVTLSELKEKCREFEEIEGKESFYNLASEIKDDHPLQAAVIILATWNRREFSKLKNYKDYKEFLINLKEALNSCKPLFDKLKDKEFRTSNFDDLANEIKEIYSKLSKIEGVKHTGASKVFHLFCPNLIVMWDSRIRRKYGKKKCREKYGIKIEGNNPTWQDFLNFQKLMQKIFGHIDWDEKEKTLPKAIDEYNFVECHKRKGINICKK